MVEMPGICDAFFGWLMFADLWGTIEREREREREEEKTIEPNNKQYELFVFGW